MDKKDIRLSVKKILENIFVILLASIPFIGVLFNNKIVNVALFLLCLITVGIIIINRKMSKEDIIITFFLIALIIYKYYTKELRIEMEFILFIITMLALRKGKYETILKSYFITQVLLYILVIVLNRIGIIESVHIYRNVNGDTIERYGLGFNHPNIAYRIYFNIVITYFLIRNKNIRNIELIFTMILSLIMYWITDSRNGIICSSMVILLIFLLKGKELKRCTPILKYMFYVLFVISFLLVNFYDNKILILEKINQLTSSRLYAINMYWNLIGTSMLGSATIIPKVAFDNFYMYILCIFGIISVVIYGRYYRNLFNVLIKNKLIIEIIVVAGALIYGLFESSIMYPYSNITLLLGSLIYENRKKQRDNSLK